MAKKSNQPIETPMDIVAGNIAGMMQRQKITDLQLAQLLGYQQARTIQSKMRDTTLFTGADLNHLCHFFGVTLEQLAHDGLRQA